MDFGDIEFYLRSNGDRTSSICTLVIASLLISIYSPRWSEVMISLKLVMSQAAIDVNVLYYQKNVINTMFTSYMKLRIELVSMLV